MWGLGFRASEECSLVRQGLLMVGEAWLPSGKENRMWICNLGGFMLELLTFRPHLLATKNATVGSSLKSPDLSLRMARKTALVMPGVMPHTRTPKIQTLNQHKHPIKSVQDLYNPTWPHALTIQLLCTFSRSLTHSHMILSRVYGSS